MGSIMAKFSYEFCWCYSEVDATEKRHFSKFYRNIFIFFIFIFFLLFAQKNSHKFQCSSTIISKLIASQTERYTDRQIISKIVELKLRQHYGHLLVFWKVEFRFFYSTGAHSIRLLQDLNLMARLLQNMPLPLPEALLRACTKIQIYAVQVLKLLIFRSLNL